MPEELQKPASEFLDQSEIDRILALQAAEAQSPKTGVFGAQEGLPAHKVEGYDFRHPAFLAEAELRRLRLLHEDFIRYLSARLALYLRMEVGLKMAKLTTATYAKFTDALPNPTHLSLFKVEPMIGVGILDLNPRLALTIADRLLGGRGHSIKADRYLTEIEIALLEDVILIILDEWCTQWKAEQELHPVVIGHENNGRFLQTSPKDAVMLALTLECNFGDCAEQMQIGVPYYTIEPVVKRMQARRQKDTAVAATLKRPEWHGAYEGVNVPVRAEWNAFDLSLREVTSLRVGDILEMPREICAETRVVLHDCPKFVGTVGLDADHVAVQITRKIPSGALNHAKPD